MFGNTNKKGTTMGYRDRLNRYDEERKRRNRRTGSTEPSFYQSQTNIFYPDGSYTSETSSDCGSSSGSSYDSGSSSSSSDCGGSYGE
jgi:hypothetical protein